MNGGNVELADCRRTWLGVLVLMLLPALSDAGTPLVWQASRSAAIALAQSQGKNILLISGRPTCGNCSYMKNTVCELSSPNIRGVIDQSYVPWLCDIDTSSESSIYMGGLGSYTLPMICCIDPNNAATYLDRTTNVQDPTTFYNRLLSHVVSGWDAGFQDLGEGWRRLGWFGDFRPMGGSGWIWHNAHGFLYVAPGSTPHDIWFYSQSMGWLWTKSTTYPFLFRASDGAWLWYLSGSTNPRWFFNYKTSSWEQH